jgi:DnaJ-class molecular chaperone
MFSSIAHIKQQYKRKSLKYHPDKHFGKKMKEQSEAMFIDLTEAYKA